MRTPITNIATHRPPLVTRQTTTCTWNNNKTSNKPTTTVTAECLVSCDNTNPWLFYQAARLTCKGRHNIHKSARFADYNAETTTLWRTTSVQGNTWVSQRSRPPRDGKRTSQDSITQPKEASEKIKLRPPNHKQISLEHATAGRYSFGALAH